MIEGPDAWYSSDQLAAQDEWLHVLTQQHVAELEAAVEGALASGLARVDDTGKYLVMVGLGRGVRGNSWGGRLGGAC